MQEKVSVIIPSARDPYLQDTVDDIREKAEGPIEIIVVLDGTWEDVDGADKVIFNEKRIGMRSSINKGVEESTGDYIMKCDSHCMFDEGFDRKLLIDIQKDWIVVPVRYALDVEKWERTDDEPIIYDRLAVNSHKIGGVRWRRPDRKDIMIDETMVHQGSCYLMSREHKEKLGPLQNEGYGSLMQESIEVSLKTWLGGGKVMVNKHTWYAHKHRRFKRNVGDLVHDETKKSYDYSKDFWLNNRWEDRVHDFNWLMERFGCKT